MSTVCWVGQQCTAGAQAATRPEDRMAASNRLRSLGEHRLEKGKLEVQRMQECQRTTQNALVSALAPKARNGCGRQERACELKILRKTVKGAWMVE